MPDGDEGEGEGVKPQQERGPDHALEPAGLEPVGEGGTYEETASGLNAAGVDGNRSAMAGGAAAHVRHHHRAVMNTCFRRT